MYVSGLAVTLDTNVFSVAASVPSMNINLGEVSARRNSHTYTSTYYEHVAGVIKIYAAGTLAL